MNNFQKRRLIYVIIMIVLLALAVSLILYALKKNINVFLTPTDALTAIKQPDYRFRLGGMVKKNSVRRATSGLDVNFIVTDFKHDVLVRYNGILPDLFRENKGVIVEGFFQADGLFKATQVFAKHDENYMPKKVYNEWRERQNV